jgi:hypothetical protein
MCLDSHSVFIDSKHYLTIKKSKFNDTGYENINFNFKEKIIVNLYFEQFYGIHGLTKPQK